MKTKKMLNALRNAFETSNGSSSIDAQVMRVCQHYGISCKADGIGWILG